MKRILACVVSVLMVFGLAACSAPDDGKMGNMAGTNNLPQTDLPENPSVDMDGESHGSLGDISDGDSECGDVNQGGESQGSENHYTYGSIKEQPFVNVSDEDSSYFSLNRNTATYSMVRSLMAYGQPINPDWVRIEELINYFDYDFPAPESEAVSVSTYLSDCPWNAEHKLMLAGIKTAETGFDNVNGNYVFLIDVSGSMSGDSKLGLAKKGLKKLLAGLGEKDVVSIVTYANSVTTVLDGAECTAQGKEKIINTIENLKAGGSTYGSGGLTEAYNVAEKHYITGGNNRVIIISDGDFNVGVSTTDEMLEFISARTVAKKNVYLSVLGVGMGNLRDDMLETMARHGNGNYAYLDNETEAEKVFCHDLKGTLITVAKDAKAGVTFTENVVKYRLIGYDALIISKDEFEDKTTDAGELGSNLCVAVLYEIQLNDGAEGKLADVEIRYKDVRNGDFKDKSAKSEVNLSSSDCNDLAFISCVAEFGLVLRQSKYATNANPNSVRDRLERLEEYIADDSYRSSFVTLVDMAIKIYNKENL